MYLKFRDVHVNKISKLVGPGVSLVNGPAVLLRIAQLSSCCGQLLLWSAAAVSSYCWACLSAIAYSGLCGSTIEPSWCFTYHARAAAAEGGEGLGVPKARQQVTLVADIKEALDWDDKAEGIKMVNGRRVGGQMKLGMFTVVDRSHLEDFNEWAAPKK